MTAWKAPLLLLGLALIAGPARAQSVDGAAALIGGRFTYEVKPGDTLGSIAARYGVAPDTLIEVNQLQRSAPLPAGRSLVIDNTHIAVANPLTSITINVAQRFLVLTEGERVRAYPIAVGRRDWPTPVGAFTVLTKETDPAWDVPVSIQREMASQGKPVIVRMEPSAENPLGRHWIGLSLPGLGIHGTNAPASIYTLASHGCIRMHPDDVSDLFQRVTIGASGVLVYQPVILALIDGRVMLEAHPDSYRRSPNAAKDVRSVIERAGLAAHVDWTLIDNVLRQRRGQAVDVMLAR